MRLRITYTNWPTVRSAGTRYLRRTATRGRQGRQSAVVVAETEGRATSRGVGEHRGRTPPYGNIKDAAGPCRGRGQHSEAPFRVAGGQWVGGAHETSQHAAGAHFFLSMSGMLVLSARSTITCSRGERRGRSRGARPRCGSAYVIHAYACLMSSEGFGRGSTAKETQAVNAPPALIVLRQPRRLAAARHSVALTGMRSGYLHTAQGA